MGLEVCKVSWSDILGAPEGERLVAEYAAECAIPEMGAIDPQATVYASLESAHVLQILGAYQDEALTGFAGILTYIHPHYSVQVASMDSLFVSKPYRTAGLGTALLGAVEAFARDSGSMGVLYSAPPGSRLERLLDVKGYQRAATVFFRRLEA